MNKLFSEITQEQIDEAKETRGWLQKKSPSLLKGFQKRYFLISQIKDVGYVLAYFVKQIDPKPKGFINIGDILDIHYDGEKNFTIVYPDRHFELKASNSENRNIWVKQLMIIKRWLRQMDSPTKVKIGRSVSALKIDKAWK